MNDLDALDLIRACGFVGVDATGAPFLASGKQIETGTLKRLIARGLLVSNDDALFGGPPQSYRPVAPCTN